ncbi:MAG: SsrA-binding protein SmpB [Deltaproteobacteria bacterium]|jgi:SsrA-binding protein|nr:SsrA-binding protein SmpB [Deltaproteobacteria bacterium]
MNEQEGPQQGKAKGDAKAIKLVAENRKARHEYEVLDTLEAGLVLCGSEVKSLRNGKGNIAEAWIKFVDGEAWLCDAHISHYVHAHQFNHEPRRERKLLLRNEQIEKWQRKVAEKGHSVIALKLFFSGPWCKVQIGLAKGRKLHDKRDAIKEREDHRELQRSHASRR